MIREDLLDFKYYLDRLSLFMKESYGIKEHIKTFYRQLEKINSYFDEFLKYFNIWGNNPKYIPTGEILDNIGEIFGCHRKFTIPIISNNENKYYMVNLTDDDDYLLYIKCQIIKQNFMGTNENLEKFYNINNNYLPFNFTYMVNQEIQNNIAQCNIYFNNYDAIDKNKNPIFSDNIKILFENGYLTIESMGILYRRLLQNINKFAKYEDKNEENPNNKELNIFSGEKNLQIYEGGIFA